KEVCLLTAGINTSAFGKALAIAYNIKRKRETEGRIWRDRYSKRISSGHRHFFQPVQLPGLAQSAGHPDRGHLDLPNPAPVRPYPGQFPGQGHLYDAGGDL